MADDPRKCRVQLTVETSDQYVSVARYGEKNTEVAQLFAEAVWRVADTFHAEVLEDIARAVADAVRARAARKAGS